MSRTGGSTSLLSHKSGKLAGLKRENDIGKTGRLHLDQTVDDVPAHLPIVYHADQSASKGGAPLIPEEQDERLAAALSAAVIHDLKELLAQRLVPT